MNQRNVEALQEVLRLLDAAEVEEGYGHFTRQQAAQWLASQGVLVPSVLTPKDVVMLDEAMPKDGNLALTATAVVRGVLAHIAKGEEAHSGV